MRFLPCADRGADLTKITYEVLRGIGTVPPSCLPPVANLALTYTYTPTSAEVGMVTVSELGNGVGTGLASTFYIRTFEVYDAPPPSFTVAPCPSGSVQVTLTDATYDSYTVQAGTGPTQPITRSSPETVVLAGASTVTVVGKYAAGTAECNGVSTQTITTLAPAPPPVFTSLNLEGALPSGTATLAVGGLPPGYVHTIQVADASGVFRDLVPAVPVPAGSTSITLPTPTAGRYRIFRTDACGISNTFSSTISTVSLTGSSALNRNNLRITTDADPSTTYTITRSPATTIALAVVGGEVVDTDVECGTTYTYRVTALQPGGTAVSNEVAVTTQSNLPPRQPKLIASFNENDVVVLTPLLAAPLVRGSSLNYRRTSGSQPPIDFGTATTIRSLRDSTDLAELRAQPPCYSVRITDVCGNTSVESPPTCPVLLSASAADPEGNATTLTWTPFSGPTPGVPATYTLQRLAADGTVLSSIAVSGNSYTDLTPPTDRQILRYRLQITGAGLPSGTFSYSNRAAITRQILLTIPTAFTPNGDGLNDVLEVKGRYLKGYTFVVVDRNGQEVFRGTQRGDTWDGTIKGRAPVLGAYVWRFQQANEDGKPFKATGSVTILK
ncbi:T9SS type B sorting domain-containing protein [Hymenobacter terrenus]|uniref:T9SS type B sorting domain-containing protein n=1 Tax=Hymenobacter terrenus TaxID=1629124 RepID=UPI0018CD97E3|nr:gliding motility-associated C-terminal domain-containing protein [Hymenobacter terrenus]